MTGSRHALTAEHTAVLDALLTKPPNSPTTGFNRLKQAPGPATPKTIRLWIDRLDWLGGLLDPDPLLEGIAHTKLRQFAAEAAALEVSDLLDISQPGKRHTLLLALLRQARMRCRDELIEMMLRRIRRTQAAAKEQLDALHDQHRGDRGNPDRHLRPSAGDGAGPGSRRRLRAPGQEALGGTGRRRGAGRAVRNGIRLAPRQRSAAALADPRQAPRPAVPAARSDGHPVGDTGSQPAGRSGGREQTPPCTPR